MNYLGDFASNSTVRGKFNTRQSDGTPITLAGSPTLAVYKDSGTTESTAGVTLTVDFDGRTGLHDFVVVLSDAFYAAGSNYQVVLTAGTVDGVSVVGVKIAEFSIENRSVDAVNSVVNSIDQRLPAALVSGRIDAHVGAMAANTLTASALATDAVNEIIGATYGESLDAGSAGSMMEFFNNLDSLRSQLASMIESDGAGQFRFDTIALEQAPAGGGGGDASQATLLQVKAKTDLITGSDMFVTVDRVTNGTITMYKNESTSVTVPLAEDTTSKTLRFTVEDVYGTDVLTIANASITRTSTSFTVTIPATVTDELANHTWALRDITGGINRLVRKGVLTVQAAADNDA